MTTSYAGVPTAVANAQLLSRLERIPVTRRLLMIRVIIGSATFFDAYTVLVIAFAMPALVTEWGLNPGQVGMILSAGYVGQIFGAIGFGWIAERIGRMPTLLITILLFVSMDIACLFAWNGTSMMIFRFFQGVGTGGEVPIASAYINEFIGAKKRGRFFLLYEVPKVCHNDTHTLYFYSTLFPQTIPFSRNSSNNVDTKWLRVGWLIDPFHPPEQTQGKTLTWLVVHAGGCQVEIFILGSPSEQWPHLFYR